MELPPFLSPSYILHIRFNFSISSCNLSTCRPKRNIFHSMARAKINLLGLRYVTTRYFSNTRSRSPSLFHCCRKTFWKSRFFRPSHRWLLIPSSRFRISVIVSFSFSILFSRFFSTITSYLAIIHLILSRCLVSFLRIVPVSPCLSLHDQSRADMRRQRLLSFRFPNVPKYPALLLKLPGTSIKSIVFQPCIPDIACPVNNRFSVSSEQQE